MPNFLRGLDGQLRFGSPSDLTDREYMTFMVRALLAVYIDEDATLSLHFFLFLGRMQEVCMWNLHGPKPDR